MRKTVTYWCGVLFLLISFQAAGADAKSPEKDEKDKYASSQPKDAAKDAAKPDATGEKDDKAAVAKGKEGGAEQPALSIGSDESLILSSGSNSDVIAVVCKEGDDLVLYSAMDDEEVPHYIGTEGSLVFPEGTVVEEECEEPLKVKAYTWGRIRFNLDFEKKAGFIAYLRAGYQWNHLRKTGFEVGGYRMNRNITMSGATASLGIGYNFGPDVPVALEMDMGIGPNIRFSNRRQYGNVLVDAKQKLSFYNLDASIDYEFRRDSHWTPFIGVTTGVALITERGRLLVDSGGGQVAYGEFKRKHRVNLMGGMRAGAKIQVNEKVTLSAVAAYNYLGDVPAQHFALSDGTQATTNRIKAHELSMKLGVKVHF